MGRFIIPGSMNHPHLPGSPVHTPTVLTNCQQANLHLRLSCYHLIKSIYALANRGCPKPIPNRNHPRPENARNQKTNHTGHTQG